MLSEERTGAAAMVRSDGRYEVTRDARADAQYAARPDARASFVCWHRGMLDSLRSSAVVGYMAGPGEAAGASRD
jgi:hypothetical protein